MEIYLKTKEQSYNINLDKNVIIFGQDCTEKNSFINNLSNSLLKEKKNILINGKNIEPNEYNIIIINEDSDFANEFKFTKNNTLKQLIYQDINKKINEEKLINYTNEIFDIIDEKVNNLLDRKINKKFDNKLSFEIEIPDINSIIDKFTNIYIDNLLLNSNEISKSIKRKLLYQLYFLEIKNNNKNNIVIINNFDTYLNSNEIITILNTINNLTNENNHFILTSTSNIFEYISQEHFTVYKYMNKLINLDTIDEAIKIYLLKKEYNEKENFDTFYQQNESLIHKQEIIDIKEKLLNIYPHCLSKILNCTSINIAQKKPKHITSEYIICENKDLQQLFVEICNFLVDIN